MNNTRLDKKKDAISIEIILDPNSAKEVTGEINPSVPTLPTVPLLAQPIRRVTRRMATSDNNFHTEPIVCATMSTDVNDNTIKPNVCFRIRQDN